MNVDDNTGKAKRSREISGLEKMAVMTTEIVPYQKNMYPVDIVELHPSPLGTKHLRFIGSGRDGNDYAIKRISDDKTGTIPATEFFCYELARLLNITTPEWSVVKLEGDELAFGSVWHGESELDDVLQRIKFFDGNVGVKNLGEQLSKIFAFDLFVNNTDRHLGNYLFRTSGYSNNKTIIAFDFGLSWWGYGLGGLDVLDLVCNTQVNFAAITHSKIMIKTQESLKMLADIAKVNSAEIKTIVDGIPEQWLKLSHRHELIQWWGSEEFLIRLEKLRQEIKRHELV